MGTMKSDADFEHRREPYPRTVNQERKNQQGVRVPMRFPRISDLSWTATAVGPLPKT